jgi:hypothetical protein
MGFFNRNTAPPNSGRPAISLEKVTDQAPGLVDLYKEAGVGLNKNGLQGERAAVYLVLDRSGSMRKHYRSGAVQHLAEQALALAANLDDDGIVPVVFFDSDAYTPINLDLTNYQGRIGAINDTLGHMGTTNYAAAMRAVIALHEASGATVPAFVVFQTDGSPDSRAEAERVLCEAATLPIFWQFIGFGDDKFEFLHKLDDLPVPTKRVIDNAGFFEAGADPLSMRNTDLYGKLMSEYPQWLAAYRTGGFAR